MGGPPAALTTRGQDLPYPSDHELTRCAQGPVPDSYWILEGKLLAGEYPGTYTEEDTREKLGKFLDAGIRTFIDLTESREQTDYDHVLRALPAARGVETKHIRHAIRDFSIPREPRRACSRMCARG